MRGNLSQALPPFVFLSVFMGGLAYFGLTSSAMAFGVVLTVFICTCIAWGVYRLVFGSRSNKQ